MIAVRVRHRFAGFTLDAEFRSDGPVVGVFGRSGSGKSTLLAAVAGALDGEVSRVEVGGELLADRPGKTWTPPERRGLALVTQDPLLFPHLSTRRNLTYAPGAKRELASERGAAIVDVLRLGELLERNAGVLSGGERQRVALGRALLSRPRMLLLDEPASALDAELAREVLALLAEVKASLGTPMLFVTHRASELLSLADECVVLDDGQVVAQGEPIDVLSRPRDAGVARLVGVDNLMRLAVVEHDEAAGITHLDLGDDVRLASPLCAAAVGAPVDVGVYAEDVILCREPPGATSARNVLAGTVASLDAIGHEVLVGLRLGATPFRVRVTPGAARDLGLAEGQPIVALIKTTACHHLGGG